ncbi:hypothetical protein ABIF20_008764 [Bradyrhizobium japonicum]
MPEFERVLQFTVDPDEQFGAIERGKAILQDVFRQGRYLPQHGLVCSMSKRRSDLEE